MVRATVGIAAFVLMGCRAFNPEFSAGGDTGAGTGAGTAMAATVGADTAGGSGSGTSDTGGGQTGSGATTATPNCVPQSAEVCDGVDNDCDAKIDEASDANPQCNGCEIRFEGPIAYYYCVADGDWFEADAGCRAFGAELVSMLDATEDQLVTQTRDGLGHGEVWIGLNDLAFEGTFAWSDGEPLTYEVWRTGQPDDFNQAEDCVELASTAGWNDLPCDRIKSGYICKDRTP